MKVDEMFRRLVLIKVPLSVLEKSIIDETKAIIKKYGYVNHTQIMGICKCQANKWNEFVSLLPPLPIACLPKKIQAVTIFRSIDV